MSTPQISLFTILSESKRIIKAHSYHFLALSALFLFPISFSITLYPILRRQLLLHFTTLDAKTLLTHNFNHSLPMFDKQSLVFTLFYMAFVFVLSLCATVSITYSVFEGFYCRPVKFISAIKSILTSFLPISFTTIVCQTILTGFLFFLSIILFLVVKLVKLVGFHFEYSSPYFMWLALVFLIIILWLSVHLQVNWAVSPAVVVVESSWGLKPLKRSAGLIKRYRSVALSLYLYFSIVIGILVCSSSLVITMIDGEWSLPLVLQVSMTSLLLTWLFLLNGAAYTVLYIYCKSMHGDDEIIGEEFASEYVSLAFEGGKIPHLASITYTT